jgi:NAD(P)-dependent dehydrogenase (short-subunit alcohol dehydrogenase family)
MDEFTGKTAVITGAGSGMGKAFALRWAAEGMNVVLGDIQQDALDATVAEIQASGGPVVGVRTDVSKLADIEALADAVEAAFGPVHLVHNNAGVEGYLDGPIWAATARDREWTVGVNFWSVVHGVRTFVPRMLAHGQEGHIVNTCSMTSVAQATNMYGITKHATIALSEVLWSDLRKAGAPIGVTALCPGTIATNLFYRSRNRPDALTDDGGNISAEGKELRDRMHLVLAAGMPPSEVAGKVVAPMTELTVEDFDRAWAVNARGVFMGLRAVLKIMKPQRSGAIVNTASMAAIKGAATFSPYIAAKHAVLGLTKSAALEGGPYNIRVNCVGPGHVDTRMARDLTKQINPDDPEGVFREVSASVPLYGRYGTATEVSNLVVFLLSDEAEYISGSLHLIDGALNAG